MLKKAGAIPVELTSDRIYAAMQDGSVDGALTSYETFVSTKIYEHAKYFTAGTPGIWMFATPLVIAKSVWDRLSDSEQHVFESAAVVSEDYFATTQAEAERKFIDTFHSSRRQVPPVYLRGISELAASGATDGLERVRQDQSVSGEDAAGSCRDDIG
jgi:TRAP-type C4-dicarboxylate transport system substrate-binding protein